MSVFKWKYYEIGLSAKCQCCYYYYYLRCIYQLYMGRGRTENRSLRKHKIWKPFFIKSSLLFIATTTEPPFKQLLKACVPLYNANAFTPFHTDLSKWKVIKLNLTILENGKPEIDELEFAKQSLWYVTHFPLVCQFASSLNIEIRIALWFWDTTNDYETRTFFCKTADSSSFHHNPKPTLCYSVFLPAKVSATLLVNYNYLYSLF